MQRYLSAAATKGAQKRDEWRAAAAALRAARAWFGRRRRQLREQRVGRLLKLQPGKFLIPKMSYECTAMGVIVTCGSLVQRMSCVHRDDDDGRTPMPMS